MTVRRTRIPSVPGCTNRFQPLAMLTLSAEHSPSAATIRSSYSGAISTPPSVELPGRHFDGIAPERAADILLEIAGNRSKHDAWTLIEPLEAQKVIAQQTILERRRVRQH